MNFDKLLDEEFKKQFGNIGLQPKPADSNHDFELGILAGVLLAVLGILAFIGLSYLLSIGQSTQPTTQQAQPDPVVTAIDANTTATTAALTELKAQVATLKQQLAQSGQEIQRLNTTINNNQNTNVSAIEELTDALITATTWAATSGSAGLGLTFGAFPATNLGAAQYEGWDYVRYQIGPGAGQFANVVYWVPCWTDTGTISYDNYDLTWSWTTRMAFVSTVNGDFITWNI